LGRGVRIGVTARIIRMGRGWGFMGSRGALCRVYLQRLTGVACSEFRLDWNGIHGAAYWSRVRHNGMLFTGTQGMA
jgi:hypothetical protein